MRFITQSLAAIQGGYIATALLWAVPAAIGRFAPGGSILGHLAGTPVVGSAVRGDKRVAAYIFPPRQGEFPLFQPMPTRVENTGVVQPP